MTLRERTRLAAAHGFTLIELLVVMSLIVVLSSVALVGYQNSIIRAREATLAAHEATVTGALVEIRINEREIPRRLALDKGLRDAVADHLLGQGPLPPEPPETLPAPAPAADAINTAPIQRRA